MPLHINIKTIPHNQHPYDTLGDYDEKNGVREVRVTAIGNTNYEFMIAIHELIEQHLCLHRGISEETISAWDMSHLESDDPGHELGAPYGNEHRFAENIERQLCTELGIDWQTYQKEAGF